MSPLHLVLVAGLLASPVALAQPDATRENPVFVNDSPAAAEAILRAQENVAGGNQDQAVRVLQKLLDEEPDALVPSAADPLLFVSVRERANAMILADRALLDRYRAAQEPVAAEGLKRGEHDAVALARLLTSSGLRAALMVAAGHLENAQFHAALMTLELVRDHPDRPATPAAAAVATALSAYVPGERMARLLVVFGAARAEPVVPPPFVRSVSPLSPLAPADLEGIVAQPLATEAYTTDEPIDTPRFAGVDSGRVRRPLGTLPTVSGDAIYLSSLRHLAALDRFTLRERWRIDLQALLNGVTPDRPTEREQFGFRNFRSTPTNEDGYRVTLRAGTLLTAAATIPVPGEDPREVVLAVDAKSGRVRWRLTPGEIDPALAQASIRGPILAEGDIAVITFRKEIPARRVTALMAAGVTVGEGRPLWWRLIGSVGSLPWNRGPTQVTDGGVIDEGVLYRPDRLGVVAAYALADGRPLWVRRLTADLWESASGPMLFASSLPIIDGDGLIVLSPDRRQVVTLDKRTGAILATASAELLGRPSYLLRAGETLIGVSDSRVAVMPLRGGGAVHLSPTLGEPNPLAIPGSAGTIRGRVVVAGDRLLVPTTRSVLSVNPADVTAPPAETLLDNTGNLVYDDGQLLACDDTKVFNYLAWNEADRLLTGRLKTNPTDAASGVALAELAHRAGHPERILFGADAALEALGDRRAEAQDADRARLALALRTMVEGAQEQRPGEGQARTGTIALERPLIGGLVERMGRVAVTPEERAATFILRGTHEQNESRPEQAAAAFQAVLDDADVAAATVTSRQITMRAETEATRRLEKLITAVGRSAYGAIDARIEGAVRALGAGVSVDELERVARRFPVGLETPGLWTRIAAIHRSAGRERAAARALEMGLQCAERIPDAPVATVGELAGGLVSSFESRGLAAAAGDTLRRVRARFGPQLSMTVEGRPLETERLSAELTARVAAATRWPRVGRPTGEGVQALAGWMAMEPLIAPIDGVTPTGVVMVNQEKQVALFAARVPAGGGAEALEAIWTFEPGSDEVRLVKVEAGAVFLFVYGSRNGGTLLKIDTATGQRLWRSQPVATYFDEQARRPDVERFRHPLGPLLSTDTIVATIDDRTAVLIERSGRIVALDADSGGLLWAATVPLERVFDGTVSGNLLALAGDHLGRGEQELWIPTVMMLDARTGQVAQQYLPTRGVPLGAGPDGDGDGRARWLRINSRGDLVAGLDGAVVALDPESGQVLWRMTDAPAVRSVGAYVRGDGLFLIAEDHALHQVALASGTLRTPAVETRGRLLSDGEVYPFATAEGNLAISSAQGVVIVNGAGALVGADALGATDNLLAPMPGAGVFVTMETGTSSPPPAPPQAALGGPRAPRNIGLGIRLDPDAPAEREPALLPYTLHILDARSGAIVEDVSVLLGDAPSRLTLLDGRVLITAGRSTIVFRAPAREP
ncbi:MAG: outer membrane protein assembly factor BamB family protein [Phycisphaerales bacterium]